MFQFACDLPPTLVAFKSDNCLQSCWAKREYFQWNTSSYKSRESQQVGRGKQLIQIGEWRSWEKFQYESPKTFWLDNHLGCVCFLISVQMGHSICSPVLPQPIVKGQGPEMKWRKIGRWTKWINVRMCSRHEGTGEVLQTFDRNCDYHGKVRWNSIGSWASVFCFSWNRIWDIFRTEPAQSTVTKNSDFQSMDKLYFHYYLHSRLGQIWPQR